MSVIKERPRRYPETNLELIEESTSRDEILYQHAQLTTEQTVDRCHGGRGTLDRDQFVTPSKRDNPANFHRTLRTTF